MCELPSIYIAILIAVVEINWAYSLEREMTISIDPGKEDCFYQSAKRNDVIDIEYQVIDGGHGDLDITFHIIDPSNRILVADYKKSENNQRVDVASDGDYKFCFDNTFSSYNVKTVFFELIIDNEDDSEGGSNENIEFGLYGGEILMQDVQEIINTLRNHLNKVRHLQDLIKSNEARDRNIAEENYFKVNTLSMIQIGIMLTVGCIQVVLVRSLFDDRSKAHQIWKNLDWR